MSDIADLVGVTPTEVFGTATFYDMLHTEPVGTHVVSVCTNIACLLNGAAELLDTDEKSRRHGRFRRSTPLPARTGP